ncbi:hypothetical protein DEU56DRAFT_904886 [Suillus clintonianus]|uniref:uncharacterized protein n=1 Tax=Suillus clintonianus TaxID=1904413 RepID=UPI001B85C5DD|nr:uncharacterized protein DEU56DRAFT_904886 [Suillus clintonianus]KAG2119345.1 hypothetical protein DEU56DRAFT_904886 [Suillus clintonianus]
MRLVFLLEIGLLLPSVERGTVLSFHIEPVRLERDDSRIISWTFKLWRIKVEEARVTVLSTTPILSTWSIVPPSFVSLCVVVILYGCTTIYWVFLDWNHLCDYYDDFQFV